MTKARISVILISNDGIPVTKFVKTFEILENDDIVIHVKFPNTLK